LLAGDYNNSEQFETMGVEMNNLTNCNVCNPSSNNLLYIEILTATTGMWGRSSTDESGRILVTFTGSHDYVVLNILLPLIFPIDFNVSIPR